MRTQSARGTLDGAGVLTVGLPPRAAIRHPLIIRPQRVSGSAAHLPATPAQSEHVASVQRDVASAPTQQRTLAEMVEAVQHACLAAGITPAAQKTLVYGRQRQRAVRQLNLAEILAACEAYAVVTLPCATTRGDEAAIQAEAAHLLLPLGALRQGTNWFPLREDLAGSTHELVHRIRTVPALVAALEDLMAGLRRLAASEPHAAGAEAPQRARRPFAIHRFAGGLVLLLVLLLFGAALSTIALATPHVAQPPRVPVSTQRHVAAPAPVAQHASVGVATPGSAA